MKQKTGEASVTLSTETTALTHFWQFYRQMEGCAANTNTPDLIDTSGAALKTSKEKGSALFQHFVQQSNRGNLDERIAVWKGLDRTLTESDSNDDLTTKPELTEALSGLSRDTAPGPVKVKYLSVYNKSELFRLYEESFATGPAPEDWSHSYLKPIPKPGKDHSKLNGYRILTMQNATRKLMEWIVVRTLAQDLERGNVLPPKQGGYGAGKNTWENAARFAYDCLFVGWLLNVPATGYSLSQGRIWSDNFTCCHTQIEVADQTFYLTQSQYTDTGPTSPSADPITPGAWQVSHWSANFEVTGMTRPRKNPGAGGIRTQDFLLSGRTPYHLANETVYSHTMSTKDSRGRKKTLAVEVDLEDACNRVQFKLLMELLVQCGVSLTLTRWFAAAL